MIHVYLVFIIYSSIDQIIRHDINYSLNIHIRRKVILILGLVLCKLLITSTISYMRIVCFALRLLAMVLLHFALILQQNESTTCCILEFLFCYINLKFILY